MDELFEKLFQYIDLRIQAGIENHNYYYHDQKGVWLGPAPEERAENLKEEIKKCLEHLLPTGAPNS